MPLTPRPDNCIEGMSPNRTERILGSRGGNASLDNLISYNYRTRLLPSVISYHSCQRGRGYVKGYEARDHLRGRPKIRLAERGVGSAKTATEIIGHSSIEGLGV